jgi:hypothetical protein
VVAFTEMLVSMLVIVILAAPITAPTRIGYLVGAAGDHEEISLVAR